MIVLYIVLAFIAVPAFTWLLVKCVGRAQRALREYYDLKFFADRVDRSMQFGRNRLQLIDPKWTGMPSSKFLLKVIERK